MTPLPSPRPVAVRKMSGRKCSGLSGPSQRESILRFVLDCARADMLLRRSPPVHWPEGCSFRQESRVHLRPPYMLRYHVRHFTLYLAPTSRELPSLFTRDIAFVLSLVILVSGLGVILSLIQFPITLVSRCMLRSYESFL